VAGLVENEEDYLHSSARDFFDKKGLIELSYVVWFNTAQAWRLRQYSEAGLVENEEDYLYSSARDFFDKKGLIELSYVVWFNRAQAWRLRQRKNVCPQRKVTSN